MWSRSNLNLEFPAKMCTWVAEGIGKGSFVLKTDGARMECLR